MIRDTKTLCFGYQMDGIKKQILLDRSLYWELVEDEWKQFTLNGLKKLNPKSQYATLASTKLMLIADGLD